MDDWALENDEPYATDEEVEPEAEWTEDDPEVFDGKEKFDDFEEWERSHKEKPVAEHKPVREILKPISQNLDLKISINNIKKSNCADIVCLEEGDMLIPDTEMTNGGGPTVRILDYSRNPLASLSEDESEAVVKTLNTMMNVKVIVVSKVKSGRDDSYNLTLRVQGTDEGQTAALVDGRVVSVGDRIEHAKFGKGVIKFVNARDSIITVYFDSGETKRLHAIVSKVW